jgi:hypothetical protein
MMEASMPRRSRNSEAEPIRDADPRIATETFIWDGTTIEVVYEPDWCRSSEGPFPRSHLSITTTQPAKTPLPITESGYRSHFLEPGEVEAAGGAVAYVRTWLDEAAKEPKWRRGAAKRRQLDLFG